MTCEYQWPSQIRRAACVNCARAIFVNMQNIDR